MKGSDTKMKFINKKDVPVDALPGRGLLRIVGKNSVFDSDQMSVGYALYSETYGEMEPHSHAEETVIITRSVNGWIEWGDAKDHLTHRCALEEGMVFHIPAGEWHVFRYEAGGMVEIVFIYGQADQVRPEDK